MDTTPLVDVHPRTTHRHPAPLAAIREDLTEPCPASLIGLHCPCPDRAGRSRTTAGVEPGDRSGGNNVDAAGAA